MFSLIYSVIGIDVGAVRVINGLPGLSFGKTRMDVSITNEVDRVSSSTGERLTVTARSGALCLRMGRSSFCRVIMRRTGSLMHAVARDATSHCLTMGRRKAPLCGGRGIRRNGHCCLGSCGKNGFPCMTERFHCVGLIGNGTSTLVTVGHVGFGTRGVGKGLTR